MTTDRVALLDALLVKTKTAHGVYEATELDGVYDEDWPRWYAEYAVEQGIGELLGREVSVDELAEFLARSWAEARQANAAAAEEWSSYTARRIAAELSER